MHLRYSISGIVLLVLLDQLLKLFVNTHIILGTSFNLIPGLISLANIHNSGAAWSMLENQRWLFLLLAAVATIVLFYYLIKTKKSAINSITLIFLLAGTLGNGIDRLLHDYVIDMFQLNFINFPIFNLADSFLTIGVILLFWIVIREK